MGLNSGVRRGASVLTQHYISLLGFFLEQFNAVKVSINKPRFRVLAGNLGAFIAVANKARNVKFGMGIGNRIQSIATDVSCRARAVIRGLVVEDNARETRLQEDLGGGHQQLGLI